MNTMLRRIALGLVLFAGAAGAVTTVDDLFTSAAVDDVRGVRRVLQERAIDPKVLDSRGDTLLIAAIRNDAARVTDYLIAEQSTDLDATDAVGETAMMIAAYRDRKDVVQKLVSRGAEVNRTGWTALHYAASVGSRDIVDLLLDNAAYIDAESPNLTTPLMMAARGGFVELARHLVDAGADPTPVNQRDLTAADFARRSNNDELAQWLEEKVVAWRARYGTAPARAPAPSQ